MSDEPAPRVYKFRFPVCLVCNQVIGENEKSVAIPEGFTCQGCFPLYEEALDLIDATTPRPAA